MCRVVSADGCIGCMQAVASRFMTETPDERDVETRAHLLPEEQKTGSKSPRVQAEVILEESLERTEDPEGTRQSSTQTPGEGVRTSRGTGH